MYNNENTGREMFKNLMTGILNSKLTDGQLAYLTFKIHRILAEEINKAQNTVPKLRKNIKNTNLHTKAENKEIEQCKLIMEYEKELKKIMTAGHDMSENYINALPNKNPKISPIYIEFYKEYFNNKVFKSKRDIHESNGSNAIKEFDEALRGFKARK